MELQDSLCFYVSFLRALYTTHQTHHWLAKGSNFYGNHLLFERIYKTAQENADLAAEKFVGVFGDEWLNLKDQNDCMHKILEKVEDKDLIKSSLEAEKKFLEFSQSFYDALKKADKMSLGMDDMIMSIASSREEAVYLLKQAGSEKQASISKIKDKFINKLAGEDKIGFFLNSFKQAAKDNDWNAAGKIMAKIDKHHGLPRINGVESIRIIKYFKDPEISNIKVPLDQWMNYTIGYGEEWGLSDDELKKDLEFTQKVLDNIKSKTSSK